MFLVGLFSLFAEWSEIVGKVSEGWLQIAYRIVRH